MSNETIALCIIIPIAVSFFYNFWKYCYTMRPFKDFTFFIDFISVFIIIFAAMVIFNLAFSINIYAGHCEECRGHYAFLYDRWTVRSNLICPRCGAIMHY